MNRVVIIGSPGAGKSGVARSLSRKLHIRVFHLDRLFRYRNWRKKSLDVREEILQNIVREQQWIIDGNYFNTSELHLEKADTIIFLGISPVKCLRQIMKRHWGGDSFVRRDIPEGSKDKVSLLLMFKVFYYPIGDQRMFEQWLSNYIFKGGRKRVIWLCSKNEVEIFLAKQEGLANSKKKSA
jgi:adenylate kinase family enzyme